MKLYFYFLETPYKGKPNVRIEECDVKENNESYTLLGKVQGFYERLIPKSEIGLYFGCDWEQRVILEEPNVEIAKKLFSDYLNEQIEGKQKEIGKLKEKLIAVENMEGK